MVERFVYTEDVGSSSLSSPTNNPMKLSTFRWIPLQPGYNERQEPWPTTSSGKACRHTRVFEYVVRRRAVVRDLWRVSHLIGFWVWNSPLIVIHRLGRLSRKLENRRWVENERRPKRLYRSFDRLRCCQAKARRSPRWCVRSAVRRSSRHRFDSPSDQAH